MWTGSYKRRKTVSVTSEQVVNLPFLQTFTKIFPLLLKLTLKTKGVTEGLMDSGLKEEECVMNSLQSLH